MNKLNFDTVLGVLRPLLPPPHKIQDLKIFDDATVTLSVGLTAGSAVTEAQIQNALKSVGAKEIKLTVTKQEAMQSKTAQIGIPHVKHIIAVSSGKGGVGKSTVSVNLATSLALDGARVGLLDADIYGPNIPTMMGVTENPKLVNDPEKGEMFIPPVSHNVKVMSMGFLVQGDQPVIWRGPMLHNILNQFCTKVVWGELDYLVLDLPPGTGDVQLSLAQMIPLSGTVLVTTPQEISLQDVRKAMNMWEKVKVPIIGVVENMSFFVGDDGKKYHIFGQGGGELLAKKFNTELLAQMPLLSQVREGGDEGKPIVLKNNESDSAKIFRDLAKKVAKATVALDARGASGSLEIGNF